MAYISFQPTDFFTPKLYTGTAAIQSITGVGFTPDIAWFKSRTSVASHQLYDTLRGNASALVPSSTAAPIDATGDGFTSLDADGYTFNAGGGGGNVNAAQDFVAWNWKTGTTSGIGSGDITPTAYSFSTTSGVSMVEFTGTLTGSGTATIPHGLGVAPKMYITKRVDGTGDWIVRHEDMGWNYVMYLNSSGIYSDKSGNGSISAPTSTVYSTNWTGGENESGNDYISYIFAPVKGFSRFGTYKGNQSANGPFLYTGFRPAFVMVKIFNSGDPKNWIMMDDKRLGYNADNNALHASVDNAEDTSDTIDILSNGFKCRRTDDTLNGPSSLQYIWCAFAEFPFVASNEVPGTAR